MRSVTVSLMLTLFATANVAHAQTTTGTGTTIALPVTAQSIAGCGARFNPPCANTVSQDFGTVGGGLVNTASDYYATVGGGNGNAASGLASTVGGGYGNIASVAYATVAGGYGNMPSGEYSMVLGGNQNVALGVGSFAAGRSSNVTDDGAFVWGDGTGVAKSQGSNTFSVLATGGVGLFPGSAKVSIAWDNGHTCSVGAASSSWSCSSDRNLKENFRPLDVRDVLRRVVAMPVTQWTFRGHPNWPHIGPVAQDFHAAFGLGDADDDTHVDAGG